MKLSRRTFLKGVGAGGGALATTRFFTDGPQTLVAKTTAGAALKEELVPTACWIGKQDCGIVARKIGGRVVKLEGMPEHPRNLGTLCPKGVGQISALYDPNRVKTPLIRTNEKGATGRWRKASWDEALSLVAAKVQEVRAKDPKLVLWQKGRSKSEELYDEAFVDAIGASKLGHGAFCSDAGYRACEYTIGIKGVLHPDLRNARYVLAWGWNITGAGGNKLCWITWPRELVAARERGLKVVAIDPRRRPSGPHADEWLPIKPATDLALALSLSNALIARGSIDREYLTRYTNAPYLVKGDGAFLRIDGKEQVWDARVKAAKPHDAAGVAPALDGAFTVDGEKVRTAFTVLKEHIAPYTPEWAAEICGVPAEAIRRIARDLADNAMIGATVRRDGLDLPLRPVGVMFYHAAQQELGFQATRAILLAFMLLGAVGAVGGVFSDFKWKINENYEKLDHIEIKDPPYDIALKDSKFFPINSKSPAVAAVAMLDPEKFGVEKIPEVVIVHMANPVVSFPNTEVIKAAYHKFKFVTVISPWLSETADLFADVVLPAATMEKYEGPIKAGDAYTDASTLRLPIMEPLGESRGEIDIYLDLTERLGVLFGEGGYLSHINETLELSGAQALSLDRKPAVREIFDHWAKANHIDEGIAYFEEHGVKVKGPLAAKDVYGYGMEPAFGGALHRLYGESLLGYQHGMKAKGAEQIYWQDYTPLPTWRAPTMEGSPAQYDLYLISYKLVENKQSRSSFMPLLAELAPRQHIDVNPATAARHGIRDGDEAWVESHNAVTGETARVKARAHYTEAIRPDTIGMPHHFGLWVHPGAKGQGPTPNTLFPTGAGYVTNTADQSFHVKVRIYKA
ncbi:MAG: molybdopterin-dependent oxidoreductase [Actinomycetota bacterium]